MALSFAVQCYDTGKSIFSGFTFLHGVHEKMTQSSKETYTFGSYWEGQIPSLLDETFVQDGLETGKKLTAIFDTMAKVNDEGFNFHVSGTLTIESNGTFRMVRGLLKNSSNFESGWSDDIINLKSFDIFVRVFSKKCPLELESSKKLQASMKNSLEGLKKLKEKRYANQPLKQGVISALCDGITEGIEDIRESTQAILKKDYWNSFVKRLLAQKFSLRNTAIVATSYLVVGAETLGQHLKETFPSLPLFLRSAKVLKLPRKGEALLVAKVLQRLNVEKEGMKKVAASLNQQVSKDQILGIFIQAKLLNVSDTIPIKTRRFIDWTKE